MTTNYELLVRDNRDRTRVLVLRALHRANGRQRKVASRRVAWRMAQRVLLWSVGCSLVLVTALQVLQWSGAIPKLTIVIGDSPRPEIAHGTTPVSMVASKRSKQQDSTPQQATGPDRSEQPPEISDPAVLKLATEINSMLP